MLSRRNGGLDQNVRQRAGSQWSSFAYSLQDGSRASGRSSDDHPRLMLVAKPARLNAFEALVKGDQLLSS
jgi:hypothetical protein